MGKDGSKIRYVLLGISGVCALVSISMLLVLSGTGAFGTSDDLVPMASTDTTETTIQDDGENPKVDNSDSAHESVRIETEQPAVSDEAKDAQTTTDTSSAKTEDTKTESSSSSPSASSSPSTVKITASTNSASDNANNNTDSSNTDNSSASTPTSDSTNSAHTHEWQTEVKTDYVEAKTHTEEKTITGADIYEYHTVCNECGAYLDSEEALTEHFQKNSSHAQSGYTTNYPVVVGKEPSTTETETVVDEPAHTDVTTIKTCTICGAIEESTDVQYQLLKES